MAEEEVGLRTTLKDRVKTARGLDEIDRKVTGVGRSAETAGRRAAIGARGFNALHKAGRLAAVGARAAFIGALGAGYAMIRLVKSSFVEAREAQKVGALTRSTIKATGGAAKVSAVHVENLSGRLSEMAGVDDELVQTGANVLLTFKNIRNELGKNNKIFDQTTRAAIDLSATPLLNGNVTGASKMLGKALNDPLKGISALGRAGVQFSATQIKTITNLVEQNKLLGAQKIILKEVNSQVGGAAKSQASWGDKANVVWKNMEERLGVGLRPLLDDTEKWFVQDGSKALDHYLNLFEDKGVPAIEHFGHTLKTEGIPFLKKLGGGLRDDVLPELEDLGGVLRDDGIPLIKQLAHSAKPLAHEIIPTLGTTIGVLGDVLGVAAPLATDLVSAFNHMPGWAKKAIVGGALAGVVGSKTGVFAGLKALTGGGGLLGAVSKAKPLPVFVVNEGFGGVPLGGPGGKGGKLGRVLKPAGLVTAGLAPEVIAAAAAAAIGTLGLREFNNKVIPDATQPAIAPGSGGTGAVPGGLDQAFPDDNAVNSALEQIKGTFSALFGHGGAVQTDADASKRSLTNLMLEPLGANKVYATSLEQLVMGPLTDLKTPVVTPIRADTSSAIASVDALAAHTASVLNNALSGFFGSGGTTAPSPPTVTPSKPPKTPQPPVDKLPALRLGRGTVVHQLVVDGKVLAEATDTQTRRKLDDQ